LADVEGVVVAGFDFAAGSVIRADVAGHAALGFGDKFDRGDELGAFVAIAGRVDDAQRRAMAVCKRFSGHIEGEQDARFH